MDDRPRGSLLYAHMVAAVRVAVKCAIKIRIMVSLRNCNRCRRELPISNFYNPPSGIRYSCKRCEYQYSVLYRKTYPGFQSERDRDYTRRNPRRRWGYSVFVRPSQKRIRYRDDLQRTLRDRLKDEFLLHLRMHSRLASRK